MQARNQELLVAFTMILLSSHASATVNNYSNILSVLKQIDNKLVASQLAPNLKDTHSSIPEGEMLFLSLYLENNYLGEVVGVKHKSGSWLELTSFFDSLDFAIVKNESEFEGWFIDTENEFYFDVLNQTVAVNGKNITLSNGDIHLEQDEVYVDLKALESWFGLSLEVDYRALEMSLSSNQVLPIEAKLDRGKRQTSKLAKSRYATKPWKASPYRFFSSPLADVQLGYSESKADKKGYYSVLGSHDFAYLRSEYFLAGKSSDLLNQSRVKLSRNSAQGDLFKGINVTQFEVGDIVATQVGSLHQNQYARGLKLSNAPLHRLLDQNRITITGDVQNGWDVELYQNGVLVEQVLASYDGRYLFENINLLIGLNEFDIILYGPQGQVEKRTEQHFVDGNALKLGEGVYELSVTQQGYRTLDSQRYRVAPIGWLLSSRYERGVSDNMSVYGATSVRASKGSGPQNILAFGTNMTLADRFLVNLNYEKDDLSQSRVELITRAKIFDQAMRLHYKRFERNKIIAPQLRQSNTQSLLGLDFTGNVSSVAYGRLSYRNSIGISQRQVGEDHKEIKNGFNYTLGRYGFGNQIQWRQRASGIITSDGSAQLQARFGRVYSRLSVDYTLQPNREISGYSAQFNTNVATNLQAQLTYSSSLDTDLDVTKLALNWQNQKLSINTSMSYDSDDDWQFGVFGRFSVGYNTLGNDYFISHRSLAKSGSALVRVFLDENNNGEFDVTEPLIKDVKVNASQAYRHAVTNAKGVAILTSMQINRKTDIVLDETSIAEPFIIPAHEGVSITPRAGYVEYIDFPLVNSSEVEGSVYLADGKVLPYAKVKLIDQKGSEVASTESAYDGYYLLTGLKPGEYTATVDQSQMKQKSLKAKQRVHVELPNEGEVLSEVNLSLQALSKVNGVVVSLGAFSSLPILKTYFVLIGNKINKLNAYQPFYIYDSQQEKYILALSYTGKSVAKAERDCELVIEQGLTCNVLHTLIRY